MRNNRYVKMPWEFPYSVEEKQVLPSVPQPGKQEVEVTRQTSRLKQASISEIFFSDNPPTQLGFSDQLDFVWQLLFGSRGARRYTDNPIKYPKNVLPQLVENKPEFVHWCSKETPGIYICKYTNESGIEVKEAVELKHIKKNPPAHGSYPSIHIYKIEQTDQIQLANNVISKKDQENLIKLVKNNKLSDEQFRLGYLDLCLVIPLIDAFFILLMETFKWSCDTLLDKNDYENDNIYLKAFANTGLKMFALFGLLTAIPIPFIKAILFPVTVIARAVLATILTPFMFAAIKLAQEAVIVHRVVSDKMGIFNKVKEEASSAPPPSRAITCADSGEGV